MYDLFLVRQIGEMSLKEKFNIKDIKIDNNSKDKGILQYCGLTINEIFEKQIANAKNDKDKNKVIESNIAIINIDINSCSISYDIKGLPIKKEYNQYLKFFDGRGNAEYSLFQLTKDFESRLIKIYIEPYLKFKIQNKTEIEKILKLLIKTVQDLKTTYVAVRINNKWFLEIDEISDVCYEQTLGPVEIETKCPICGKNHKISFTKTKFFKGKQIITDINAEKGFKKNEAHYLNFCPQCYIKLAEGYMRIFNNGPNDEIFTLIKQKKYKLMFVPKTILKEDELRLLIFIIKNLKKPKKNSDTKKLNELILNINNCSFLKGQFCVFINENNTERSIMYLNVPIKSMFYKMDDLELPGLNKCIKENIIEKLNSYVLLDLIQNFLDENDNLNSYMLRLVESIASGTVEQDLLVYYINNSYHEDL